MERERLLIIEDNEDIRAQLTYALQDDYTVAVAGDRTQAMAAMEQSSPELVTLDLGLPPSPDTAEEGLRALEDVLAAAPGAKVVIITGNGDRDNAVAAVERGAFDYHLKPVNLEDLKVVLRRAAYLRQLERESDERARQHEASIRFTDILGSTVKMREIFSLIQRVAKTDATVLCEGESGTGKELVAKAIHSHSPRRNAPFVAINCGAIPETLLESELFGHERGSFTGASARRMGKFELGDGGSVFLDEIGELTPATQGKLLRVLQERSFHRVGGTIPIQVDIRIIAASNRPLEKMVAQGLFRDDLYYRVRVFPVRIPALRDRPEDVDPLIDWYLQHLPPELGKRSVALSDPARERMRAYEWPGNVRELRNCLERAIILSEDGRIDLRHLRLGSDTTPAEPPREETLDQARDRAAQAAERGWLRRALERAGGDRTAAAMAAGLSRRRLEAKLRELGLEES